MDKDLSCIHSEHAIGSRNWPVYERMIHVYETDKDGVLHFSNYFKIAEEALYSGLRKLGFPFENTKFSMAMINTTADYIHPIKFAEQLKIVFAEVKVSRVKIRFLMDFMNPELTTLAKIQLLFVLIEPEGRKAIPVPEQLKSSLATTGACETHNTVVIQ